MNKQITIALNACGVIIGLASLAVLFFQEKYIAGCAVLILVVLLIGWAIRKALSKPILYQDFHTYVEFTDSEGRECELKVEKNFIVTEKNVTTLFTRNIGGPGKIEFIGTNMGEMGPPIQEGNLYTIPTIFKAPLPIGKPLKHVLHVKALDCFPDRSHENFMSFANEQYKKEIGIHIKLPENKPCISAKAYAYKKAEAKELNNHPVISNKGLSLDLIVPTPEYGARYVLEWEW